MSELEKKNMKYLVFVTSMLMNIFILTGAAFLITQHDWSQWWMVAACLMFQTPEIKEYKPKDEEPKPLVKITVNGEEHTVLGPTVDYSFIIGLVGHKPDAIVSVTYKSKNYSGSLRPGSFASVEEGMRFSAYITGNA